MVKSATREWSEIAPRSQALRRFGNEKNRNIFDFFACVPGGLDFYSHQVW
jgi:hypothetical protein